MIPRRNKVPFTPLTEALTPERLAGMFPAARMVCDCPSRRDVCGSSCDRFLAKRTAMRDWFATAEVVDADV